MQIKSAEKIYLLIFCLFFSARTEAAPPFITEDPWAANYKQLQVYLFGAFVNPTHFLFVQFPAVEIDYGLIRQVEFHAIPAFASIYPQQGKSAYSMSDTEVGFKYTFIKETDSSPAFAIQPLLELPTGDATHQLGNGRLWTKLALWTGKKIDKLTTYGGFGYVRNPAPLMKNYWYGGWVADWQYTKKFDFGAEIYSQGRSASSSVQDSGAITLLNLGGGYEFASHCSVLLSIGHSLVGTKAWIGYLGLYWSNDEDQN